MTTTSDLVDSLATYKPEAKPRILAIVGIVAMHGPYRTVQLTSEVAASWLHCTSSEAARAISAAVKTDLLMDMADGAREGGRRVWRLRL